MKRLVLRYNTLFGEDLLPQIKGRAAELGIHIDSVEEIKNNPHSAYRILTLSGAEENIFLFDQELVRSPKIVRKLI